MSRDWIGWMSTAVLIATVGRQAYTQWKERSTAGVSRWLFIGQFVASVGFVTYSILLDNVVFVISNAFLLAIAVIGQGLLMRNRRLEKASRREQAPLTCSAPAVPSKTS